MYNIIRYAFENKISLWPRGQVLAGQIMGNSIVLDFSKYMNKIIES
ncbi:MAG: hypothetical protein R2771_02260 [Saprospiraceae bacterium]